MAFIYKITNKINGKVYIGKTEGAIEKRFKQHLSECNKDRCKNRPLYRAMQKHGKENFEVSLIEETDNPEEREIFWIAFYGSYSKGYNATAGGDGKSYVDYDQIESLYMESSASITVKDIANRLGIDYGLCCKYIKSLGLNLRKRSNIRTRKPVLLVETNQIFESTLAAGEYIKNKYDLKSPSDSCAYKISLVCRKLRKSAFKHTWEYVKN
jgi:group I intron endonuclease